MIEKKTLLKLRKQTGLGMLVCKRALAEASGDFSQAIDILRKQGKKIANKKLGREIEQGAIFTQTNSNQTAAVLIGLGCETDFVAKSDIFVHLSHYIADVALAQKPTTKEKLLQLKGNRETVQEEIMNVIGMLGENISLEEYYLVEGPLVAGYVHTGNKLGAIIALNQAGDTQEKIQAAKDMALQVVASDPLAVNEEGIDPVVIAREKEEVARELADSTKSEQVKKQIAEGRIRKFVEKNTLLAQPFVKDEEITNQAYLTKVAADLSVTTFKRVIVAS
ncbi:MAG: translation elongation factor Ts [Bacteroidota bacterium]